MVQLHTIAAQLALAAPAVSQSTQTRSAAANPTTAPYAIPITGFGPGNSTKWGVNTTLESSNSEILPLKVAISNPPESSTFPVRRQIVDGAEAPFELFVSDDGSETLYLGLDAKLSTVSKDSENIAVDTVPFGINIGSAKTWNGSITLHGYYDANRIDSTSWISLSRDGNDKKSFLKKGTFQFSGSVQDKDSTIILDFSNDAIVLPAGYECSGITVKPEDASYSIDIPDSILGDTSCSTRKKDDDSKEKDDVVLGKPFFQAAYVYAKKDGSVYLAQANNYNLAPKAEKFDAEGELKPPAAPGGNNSPTSSATGTFPTGTAPTSSSPPEATSSDSAGVMGPALNRVGLAFFFISSVMAIFA